MVEAGPPLDRYVVLQHLSEGGMGAIYVGKKLGAGGFEMEVVLKQLLPEFTQQEEFIDLFLREAKLSATLDHANIVHTIDLVTAGGEYFIVMEYLPGGDLRTLLKKAKRRGKRFSPAAAIRICREVLSALAYAHVKRDFDGQPLKLIHRDVSPSNILVSYNGEVKLTDFGIAKAATHTSMFYKVKGKIGYMSPEQAKSEPLDHRSDLYSLAVCLYEVITGERLFVAAGLTTSADEIYSQPVPSVSKKVPGLPAELDAIIKKALALTADERYQTAGELNEALTRCAHRNGLLIAAPELARELLDACGPTDGWRVDDDEEEQDAGAKRAGTEVYDGNLEDDDDDDDDSDLGLGHVSPSSIAARTPKTITPKTITPKAITPKTITPKTITPKTITPKTITPKSIAPTSVTPKSITPTGTSARAVRPRTEIERFAGVELTSVINMMDLEAEGAKPLVDLDSGPRQLPSPPPPAPPAPSRSAAQPVAAAPMPMSSRSAQMQAQLPTSYPVQPRPRMESPAPRKRSSAATWIFVAVILVAAAVAGMLVALSGPDVSVQGK